MGISFSHVAHEHGHIWTLLVQCCSIVVGWPCWLHEVAPQGEGTPIINSAEDGDKMVLECSDRLSSNVAAGAVRGN
jgi:hypothetical protein